MSLGIGHTGSTCGHIQYTTTIGQNMVTLAACTGMEDFNAVDPRGGFESLDLGAFLRRAGIAVGRHHDSQRRVVAPFKIERVQCAVRGCPQGGEDVGAQPHHENLRFRISEAHVVFDELGAVLGDHESGEENTAKRRFARAHGGHCRQNDFIHRAPGHIRGHDRRGRIGAHAARIRPRIAVADTLVILRGCKC